MTNLKAPLDFIQQQNDITEIAAPAGTIICNTGDECQDLIILLEGNVRVYRPADDGRSITLYHINKGESCILMASCILNTTAFPATAVVEKDARGLAIPAVKVHQWLKSETVWQQYIFSLLSQRMADLISLVDALAFRNLEVRLARWLSEHSPQNQVIATTHQAIASELASSREVISRLLKEFEHEGIILLGRGKIRIIHEQSLNKIIAL